MALRIIYVGLALAMVTTAGCQNTRTASRPACCQGPAPVAIAPPPPAPCPTAVPLPPPPLPVR